MQQLKGFFETIFSFKNVYDVSSKAVYWLHVRFILL